MNDKILLLASGMSAKQVDDYDYKGNGWTIVAINNGWRATDKWDHWVHASDYKGDRPTLKSHQIECKKYGHILKSYGGHDKCGYSITLCAGYYSLYTFKPKIIGFLGADMNYTPDEKGNTHIYGVGHDIKKNGLSDPDRMVLQHGKDDPDYLTNVYMRFHGVAEKEGCKVFNFSSDENTRLPYTKGSPNEL